MGDHVEWGKRLAFGQRGVAESAQFGEVGRTQLWSLGRHLVADFMLNSALVRKSIMNPLHSQLELVSVQISELTSDTHAKSLDLKGLVRAGHQESR